jgi:hypothetical protein
MGSRKKALITGITGQDGSYLAEWSGLTNATSVPPKWQRYWAMQAKHANSLAGTPLPALKNWYQKWLAKLSTSPNALP